MNRSDASGNPGPERLPHAVLDGPSRVFKARKIIDLIGAERFGRTRSVLEVGCGSGVIASTLSELGGDSLEVCAVDVVDNRMTSSGFRFQLVQGTTLPYESQVFDLVITNHVIEHVGDQAEQLRHLGEIHRVLRPDGCVYLAVPNKWRIVEPHYRLPFLSWLPQRTADRYVRSLRRGTHYDCLPLDRKTAERLFSREAFQFENLTTRAIRSTLRIEYPDSGLARLASRYLPEWALKMMLPVVSTMIYRLVKKQV